MGPSEHTTEMVKEKLMAAIREGLLSEGAPVPSENELARQYSLNRHQARTILADLARSGYILRSQGRRSVVALRWRRTAMPESRSTDPLIVLVLPGYTDDYTIALLRGFMQQVSGTGFAVHNISIPKEETAQEHVLQGILDLKPKGLALYLPLVDERSLDIVQNIQTAGTHVVLIDRSLPGIEADCSMTDNELLGYAITSQLCEQGHRAVGYLTDACSVNVSSGLERADGYRRALTENGIEPEDRFFVTIPSLSTSHLPSLEHVMAYRDHPTALFCGHDSGAHCAVRALRALRYDLPEHVAIGTVDDGNFEAELHGAATVTGRQDGLSIGATAAQLLLERASGALAPVRCVRIPPLPAGELNKVEEANLMGQVGAL